MSFDINLEAKCEHCGSFTYSFELNITHNTNNIAEACFGSTLKGKTGHYVERAWGRLEGNTALETRPMLEAALAKVREWSPEFEKMLPGNGWGTRESITHAIERAYLAARDAPDHAVWRCWG